MARPYDTRSHLSTKKRITGGTSLKRLRATFGLAGFFSYWQPAVALSEAVLTLTVIVNLLNILFIASLAGFYRAYRHLLKPNAENTFISKSQKQGHSLGHDSVKVVINQKGKYIKTQIDYAVLPLGLLIKEEHPAKAQKQPRFESSRLPWSTKKVLVDTACCSRGWVLPWRSTWTCPCRCDRFPTIFIQRH